MVTYCIYREGVVILVFAFSLKDPDIRMGFTEVNVLKISKYSGYLCLPLTHTVIYICIIHSIFLSRFSGFKSAIESDNYKKAKGGVGTAKVTHTN